MMLAPDVPIRRGDGGAHQRGGWRLWHVCVLLGLVGFAVGFWIAFGVAAS